MQRIPMLLQKRNVDVRVRLFYWGDLSKGVLYDYLTTANIPFTALHFGETNQNIRWLLQQIQHSDPDVVIADNVVPALLCAGWLRDRGIPTVAILRSDDAFYHGVIECFIPGPKASRVSAAVCVSEYLAEVITVRQDHGVEVRRIPSGTPIPVHRKTPDFSIFRAAYVGRLVQEQKRILETVGALTRVCKEVENVEVTIIGDGPERAEIQRLVSQTGSAVRLAGRLEPLAVQQKLLDSHVVVLLSDYEGTPTAVMEAMACGVVPVCLQMRSGISELVEHDVTGVIVQDRGDDFVAAIRRLRNDQALWQRLSAAARQRVSSHFSSDHCADKWAELLLELHRNATPRKPLRIPSNLKLPPVHPALAREDHRSQKRAWPKDWLTKARKFAGQVRRSLKGDAQ